MAKNQSTKRLPAQAPLDQLFEGAPPEARRLIQVFKQGKRDEDRKAFAARLQAGGGK